MDFICAILFDFCTIKHISTEIHALGVEDYALCVEHYALRVLCPHLRASDLGPPPHGDRKFARGFKIGWGVFFLGVLLHKKSLGHPAKAKNLRLRKLGFHPHTKPTCPRGGSLSCRGKTSAVAPAGTTSDRQSRRGRRKHHTVDARCATLIPVSHRPPKGDPKRGIRTNGNLKVT